jgi:cytochrome c oxidase assembly protein subunit 15
MWASLVSQILIVVTGAGVRLTGSGLGCPTWPLCTSDSLVNVPEMGIHGVIEFGNRLLTFVLLLIALLALVAAIVLGKERKLRSTSGWLIFGILLQAVVGGISVLANLNPWVVGLHFVISGFMIALASLQLWRTYQPTISAYAGVEKFLARALLISGSITVLIGVVVTGSGPHAGDADTPRNGLDPELWQHFHSYPGYVTLAISVCLLFLIRRRDVDGYAGRLVFWATLCLLAQAATGVAQSRLGLPVGIVIVHIILASAFISLMAFIQLAYGKRK